MNKHLILSLTVAAALAIDAQAMVTTGTTGNDVYGHTFLSIRPEYESAFPEKTSQFRNRALARCDGHGGAFQFVAFGGQSVKAKGLARYFSPEGQTELIVDSNPGTAVPGQQSNIARDINPINFGIQYIDPVTGDLARFRSALQFRPKRSVGGLGITYRQYIGRECDVADRKWFMELSAPILHVRNKMNITEVLDADVIGNSVPATDATLGFESPVDMTQAFRGTVPFLTSGVRMQNGLINDLRSEDNIVLPDGVETPKKAMSATGSDIELKFGYDYYASECCNFSAYVGLHIPASRKPNARYVFEAVPGFNQHFGFMVGGASGTEIWRDCDRSLSWEVESNARYFVQNTQTRSFDLKNRPWSRYMIVRNPDGTIQPGINFFTRSMKVSPRFSYDLNAALVFGHDCGFNAELGYNFYARQAEKVALKDEFPVDFSIIGFDADNIPDPALLNRLSNIGDNNTGANYPAFGDPAFVAGSTIRLSDLNLLSAATPAVITNLVYASIGYNWDNRCHPLFVKLGGSYEFSSNNVGLDRWLVWGGFGVSI